jgi:DNA polymerase elongation subunit (family B)
MNSKIGTNFYTNVSTTANDVLVRAVTDVGTRIQERIPFKPHCYITKGTGDTPYKTLDGKPCYRVNFDSMKHARTFFEEFKTISNFDVHGMLSFTHQYINQAYPEASLDFDYYKIRIYSLDIETTTENGFPDVNNPTESIILLSVQDIHTKKIITWGLKKYTGERTDVEYRAFPDENAMLDDFIKWWHKNCPDIITGWNVGAFDTVYLYKRIQILLGDYTAKKLSPWSFISSKTVSVRNRQTTYIDFEGTSLLDYMSLYKKYTYTNKESYKLVDIAQDELGVTKLDHSEYASFKEFYTKNWNKFVDYNIRDTELITQLEDKMRLLELIVTFAYKAKVNFTDVYSQVRTWDMIIHNHLIQKNIIIPPKKPIGKSQQFEGAYVKDPILGMHKWVVGFDLTSLYPHLIMHYNISPETIQNKTYKSGVDHYLNNPAEFQDDETVAVNGSVYTNKIEGMLPNIMNTFYAQRDIAKKKLIEAEKQFQTTKDPKLKKVISKYNNEQMAYKIALNSAYGAIGNEHFRYFDIRMAEAITLGGQLAIKWIHNKMNDYVNKILKTENKDYIIAVDTDSIYVNFEKIVEKAFLDVPDRPKIVAFIDKICQDKIIPYINTCYDELAKRHNAKNKMIMKRESISDRAIWTAKKRYILSVLDQEGISYSTPKFKIMGLEIVKSSTPMIVRKKLKDALPIILYGNQYELFNFINNYKKEFYSLRPEQIAFPRSCQGINEYADSVKIYKLSTPMHTRGALMHNHFVNKMKLTKKIPLIRESDKIKFIHLKTPNPLQSTNVIAFLDTLPSEFKVDQYIDYDTMFQKVFLDALKLMTTPLGWKTEETSSLEDFF